MNQSSKENCMFNTAWPTGNLDGWSPDDELTSNVLIKPVKRAVW
jgi:hypothetical protein